MACHYLSADERGAECRADHHLLYLCRKYGSTYAFSDYVRMFLFSQAELLTYRNLLLYINIAGTFKYFDNDEGWGFVERKGVAAISQNIAAGSN